MIKLTTLRNALLLVGLATAGASYAADKAAPAGAPTDIKSAMIQRCADEAVQLKMTDASTAKKVCSCTINVQANGLKLGEFWDIQTAAMKGQDPKGIPALQRIQPDLEKCRAGVKMNPPQAPQQAPAGK
jgi:hypothetical protein